MTAPIPARLAAACGEAPDVPRCDWRAAYARDVSTLLRLVEVLAEGQYAAFEVFSRLAERKYAPGDALAPFPRAAVLGGRGMVTFLDGPAAGVRLWLLRAPVYLRVIHATSSRDSSQEWDALDLLTDGVRLGETAYAYRRVGRAGVLHIDRRDKRGGRVGEWYATGEYRLCDPQPDAETLRDTARWQAWVQAEYDRQREGG